MTTIDAPTRTQPLTPEILVYGFTGAANPRVSPDGTRILYGLGRMDKESGKPMAQLWVANIDGSEPRQLTTGGTVSGEGVWSPDGSQIAFTSNRIEKAAGPAKSGIYLIAVGGGEARELTGHSGAIGGLSWSPDGKHLAYTTAFDPENPDEEERPADAPPPVRVTRRIDYKQDVRGYLNDVRVQLFVLEVASGERRMVTKDPVDYTDPVWSPDGQTIALKVSNRNGIYSQLGLVDVATGAMTVVGPWDGVVDEWAWSPDGSRIVFAGDTARTFQTDFFLYDVAGGETRRLTDDLPMLPDAGFTAILTPPEPVWLDERRVLFPAARSGASGLYTIDVETAELATVATWQATNSGLSVDDARRYAVQGQTSLESVGEIVVTDLQSGESRVVTSYSAPTLEATPAAKWERFEIERGGLTIEAWLLFPPDFDPAKRYPVVLDVHGGPNGHYGYSFSPMQQALAAAGFLVVFSNPRGSTSYGRDFTRRVERDWGGEDFLDLMGVVDKVLERPYTDPARTGIFGYSYGGFMTSWTIGQTDRFAAAVCGAPCFDLVSMWGTSDVGHGFAPITWGADPHEDPEFYRAHSPSTYAHRATTPTLIIHGEADERCPIGQGEAMFVALTRAGCETEFVRYPGGSHLFFLFGPAAHREDFLTRVPAWFTDHLGGAE